MYVYISYLISSSILYPQLVHTDINEMVAVVKYIYNNICVICIYDYTLDAI